MEQPKPEHLATFLENNAYLKLKRLIKDQTGLDCSGYRDEYFKRRIEIRLRTTATMTYPKYILYLNKHPEEYTNLLNDLTVNYTTFFRDADVYDYLEHKLFPKLFVSKNPVKIWSAGCASGEEPYSLAILVHKVLGRRLQNHPVQIFATDIDKDALGKAKRGCYLAKQLSPLSPLMLEQFFTKTDEGYLAKENLKSLIYFEQGDLMAKPRHCDFDLILCRNVMIYFSKEGQQHIHMNFFNALKNGGYMITGKSEILTGEPATAFTALDYITRVYQKPPKPLFP